MSTFEDEEAIFQVVVNHEEQHSIWPAHRELPAGWRAAGKTGKKPECLAFIKKKRVTEDLNQLCGYVQSVVDKDVPPAAANAAQERLERQPDGLVRITLKRRYSDGTSAVDMDPLSLLCRLAMRVPPPRFHTGRYSGVLASASMALAHRAAS